MASDGKIVFEVTADGKHAIADIKEITRAIQQETGKWDDAAGKAASGMESKFSGMLKKLAAGFSAVKIGKALLDLGKDALQAASDLQEVQNVVDVTFGENANKIETWAKNAGTQFGLTETQAKKFSSTMGAMLKSSGLAGDQIVDVSTDLAGLAADMASFYNLDFEEAFSKIRSGISGMTMPLKELGIDMSVDTMNAFALAQGLEKTFSQMTQSEQTMLRYQYLMQATADAQGDFARTSDGYANSVRQLETNLTSLKTNIGNAILPVVNELVGAINSLFEDRSGQKTVLDDFANIDADTEEKIARIHSTATEANLLAEELNKIAGSKAQQAGSKLQQFANGLNAIDLDQNKAGIVKSFVSTLATDIDTLSNIQGSSNEEAVAWLEGISAAASTLEEGDVEGWETLINTIKEGLPGLENTDFGASFFAALGGGFSDVEKQSSVLQWAVDNLGNKTNRTAQEQALWLETCKALVHTIPGLSSIINTETGEIKGGTQAVKDYIDAWEKGQTKLAYVQAHQQKKNALDSEFSDLFGLELNKDLAAWRMKKAFDEVRDIYNKYGKSLGIDKEGQVDIAGFYGITDDELKKLKEFKSAVEDSGLSKEYYETAEAYEKRKKAFDDAQEMYAEEGRFIDEYVGDVDAAKNATNEWSKETIEAAKKAVPAVAEALKELNDYYENVHSSVESSVSSTVKGLGKITTPMQEAHKKTVELQEKLHALGSRTKSNADEWDKLNKEINKYNSEKISSQGIAKNIESQAKFMDDYLQNLEKAKKLGISDEVLAELSDGSVESADYLAALAEASAPEVEKINSNFQKVIDKKKQLTDTLTDQKLSVDKTYQNLAEKAKEAVAALDLEEEAKNNTGKTIAGIAQGIGEHVSEVSEQVDSIIAELQRLDGYNIHIDFGGFGAIDFTTSTGQTAESSGRFGLDFIPHDGYLIRAHEGERLLTAQENQMYSALLHGGVAGFDLESLGGVMRDNIRPGGNVYLNGKEVGKVISDQQGKAYRSLNRSGWQS